MRREIDRGVQFDFDVHAADGRSIRATWLTVPDSELQENDPVVAQGKLNPTEFWNAGRSPYSRCCGRRH